MPPNPPSKAHGFAMRSMSLRDMQISKSQKKILGPPPPKSWLRPCKEKNNCNGNNNTNGIHDCNNYNNNNNNNSNNNSSGHNNNNIHVK